MANLKETRQKERKRCNRDIILSMREGANSYYTVYMYYEHTKNGWVNNNPIWLLR